MVALPRFRGHLINWEEGVHDVFQASTLPKRVPASAGGTGAFRWNAGGLVSRIRAVGAVEPQPGGGKEPALEPAIRLRTTDYTVMERWPVGATARMTVRVTVTPGEALIFPRDDWRAAGTSFGGAFLNTARACLYRSSRIKKTML